MIFQQAMNGLEDILAGGSITGNMVSAKLLIMSDFVTCITTFCQD